MATTVTQTGRVATVTVTTARSPISATTATTITGLLKGNGSLISAAVAGTDYEPAKGTDDNFVTDAEKTKLANLSGTNTGDQDLSGLAVKSANLSDLISASTARTNLGLGTAATASTEDFETPAGAAAQIEAATSQSKVSRSPMDAYRDIAIQGITGLVAMWDFTRAETMLNAAGTTARPGERVATIKSALGGTYDLTQSTDASRGLHKNGVLTPSTTMGYLVNSIPFNLQAGTMVFFTAPRSAASIANIPLTFWDQDPTSAGGSVLSSTGLTLRNPTRTGAFRYEEGYGMFGWSMGTSNTIAFCRTASNTLAASNAGSVTVTNLMMGTGGLLTNVPMMGIMIFNRAITADEIAILQSAFPARYARTMLLWGDSIAKSTTLLNPQEGWAWRLANEDGYNFYDFSQPSNGFENVPITGLNHFTESDEDIVISQGGSNGLAANTSAATLQGQFTSAFAGTSNQARIVCTILPRNGGFSGGADAASFEVQRLAFNAWLRTQTFYDALVDFDTIPNLTNTANTTYYSDAIHPTKAGSDLILAAVRAAIATL